MTQWYQMNKKLFEKERASLAKHYPLLCLIIVGENYCLNDVAFLSEERAIIHGTYELKLPNSNRTINYSLNLITPKNYPKYPPIMYCNDPKLPINTIDRHILKDGEACLGVPTEINIKWRKNLTISNFLENIVKPFLIWQSFYEFNNKPPQWGERSHNTKGILEFYSELIKTHDKNIIINFLKLLQRKNNPKGHEICPCGSGKHLRNCHRDLLSNLRESISSNDAKFDLELIIREDNK